MKHFFIFLFWIPSALSAQIKVDSKGDKLKGNIRMMVDYQYSLFANSNKKRVPDQTAIYTYNEDTKQETIYYYSGTDSLNWVYKNIIEFDGNNPVKNYLFSKASAHGGYIQKDSICSLITYRYNDSGKPIEVSTSQNGFDSKTSYIYDGQGNVIETNDYRNEVSFDGIPCKKSTFKYDNRGHVVQESIYYNERVVHTTYKYDSNYRYSEKHAIDSPCNREWKTIRRYDGRMNLIEEVSYYSEDNGKFREFGPHINNVYKYDDQENWVERTYYLYGKIDTYIKRVITY